MTAKAVNRGCIKGECQRIAHYIRNVGIDRRCRIIIEIDWLIHGVARVLSTPASHAFAIFYKRIGAKDDAHTIEYLLRDFFLGSTALFSILYAAFYGFECEFFFSNLGGCDGFFMTRNRCGMDIISASSISLFNFI